MGKYRRKKGREGKGREGRIKRTMNVVTGKEGQTETKICRRRSNHDTKNL
jgi:hypothetical protein